MIKPHSWVKLDPLTTKIVESISHPHIDYYPAWDLPNNAHMICVEQKCGHDFVNYKFIFIGSIPVHSQAGIIMQILEREETNYYALSRHGSTTSVTIG